MTVPFIFCASITAFSAIISIGFSIAAALGATGIARGSDNCLGRSRGGQTTKTNVVVKCTRLTDKARSDSR